MTEPLLFKVPCKNFILIMAFTFLYPLLSKADNLNTLELSFSRERGMYSAPFQLIISANSSNATIYYTLDCSEPSAQNGTLYQEGITIDSTLVVKAVAVSSGMYSKVYTHTYLFPEKSANQSKKPIGFPEFWGGAEIIFADYGMDSAVIHNPDYADQIIEAFESLPSLSLSMNTDEWFNHKSGLYVGYPNTNMKREKAIRAEFIFNTANEENFVVECGVQNQGGTSIVKWKSPKQSMRLLFKEEFGPGRLNYKLFADSEISSINTLVVDAMLNSTWIHPTDENQRTHALYLQDQLTADLHNEMGALSFHGRYFHLYLNGLYWGICNLHERPDDAFLSEYLDANREDFDILKHGPDEVVAGDNLFYKQMLQQARNGFNSVESFENFKRYIDLPAFVDYMILNFYLGNYDWAQHNYYVARNRTAGTGFRFYSWDAELVMRFLDVDYNNTAKFNEGSPTEIHTLLKENEEYRMLFADAVYKHLYNDGVLTPENFEKSFLKRSTEIEEAIVLESARWGDYREGVSGFTYTKNEFWLPEVNAALQNYIPKRRDIVVEQFRASNNKLFPKFLPPTIETKVLANNQKEITLTPPVGASGEIYFTLNGADPRLPGGIINGTKYSGKIVIANSTILKARFYSVSNSEWTALAEELFLFDDMYGENLAISEIMYHPEDDYPEFLEITNYGEGSINLNGFKISGGVNYEFKTDKSLLPGTAVVLTNDNLLFNDKYGFDSFAQYLKQLSNSGETLYLTNNINQLVDSVAYTDTIPWPVGADGDGYSIELKDGALDNALFSSWQLSEQLYGTPYNEESKLIVDASFYPNPFSGIVTVTFENLGFENENLLVDIFNQTGSKIRAINVSSYNSKIELNLSSLARGMYFIRVRSQDKANFETAVLKAVKM